MIHFRSRYETSLVVIDNMIQQGWEIYDSDEDGFWLFLET